MSKKNQQLSISILIILGFALAIVLVLRTPPFVKNPSILQENENVNLPLPISLKIPKININADIENVGLALDGTMDVPTLPENTAWFNLGPRPGEIGSSVIDGHAGWKNGKPAVFDDLYKLEIGDKIYVEDNNGVTTTFVVRELKIYAKDDNTSRVFTSDDGKSHLNLITCTGVWNELEKTHPNRLVVFADKE